MDVDKNYETVFILDPSLTQKDAEQTFKNIKDFITDNEGTIIEATNIGIIKLAYPIGGKHLGNYFFIEFKTKQKQIKNLDIFFKRNDTVIRFIICNLDKNGMSYNDNRRKNKGKVINNQKVLNLI